jgi:tetratricopeptide (TPR) repeat protein
MAGAAAARRRRRAAPAAARQTAVRADQTPDVRSWWWYSGATLPSQTHPALPREPNPHKMTLAEEEAAQARARANELSMLREKVRELETDARAQMAAGDFQSAAVSCAQALTLDEDGSYANRAGLKELETEAEHKRTAQQLVRQGLGSMDANDWPKAVKDLDGAILLTRHRTKSIQISDGKAVHAAEDAVGVDIKHLHIADIRDLAIKLNPVYVTELRDICVRKQKAHELQLQGEACLESGNNAKAVELLLKALGFDPENAEIKEEELIAEKRKRADELKLVGDNQMAAAEFATALDTYRTAQSLNPTDAELPPRIEQAQRRVDALALKVQGVHQMESRDYSGAADSLDAAWKLWPENAEIKGLLDRAVRLRRAWELKAQADDAIGRGEPVEAVRLLAEALRLDPDNAEFVAEQQLAAKKAKALELKEVGIREMSEERFVDAVATFDTALELDPVRSSRPEEDIVTLRDEAARKAEAQRLDRLGDVQADADHFDEAQARYREVRAAFASPRAPPWRAGGPV